MAPIEAAKEGIIWLKGFMAHLGIKQDQMTIYCGNLSTLYMSKDRVYRERTKHIDVRYHFICSKSRIFLKKVDTKDNPAHMLTKVVTEGKFKHYLDFLNIYIIERFP